MKKGLVSRVMVLIALFVVVCFSFIALAGKIIPMLTSEGEEDLCLKTLTFMDASRAYNPKGVIGLDESASPIISPECPIHFAEVSMRQKEEDIYSGIADEVRACWKKTGAGQLDPFPAVEGVRLNHCILCSKISFSKKVQWKYPALTGLWSYLGTQPMSLSKQTFLQYVSPQSEESKVRPPQKSDLDNIDTTKSYYLVSLFSKGQTFFYFWQITGDAIGIRLIPVDSMPESDCNYLYS